MSFADKVAALRKFFGVPTSLELLPAMNAMNAAMGIAADGALPVQVEVLIAATGIVVVGGMHCFLALVVGGLHRFLALMA